ncbi:MAG: ATP-binding protein [Pirellulaceae bacterium]|nr:ATP-binding protein [Pirellulaceae bacterium]
MDDQQLASMLAPYNPWWAGDDAIATWEQALPDYCRPVVGEVLGDLRDLPQMVSLTGPRRVGKTTALMHVIQHLILQQGVGPERILYFSFDDPEVHASEEVQRVVFDRIVERIRAAGQTSYVFLDEIQKLPRWELFLKKYYDLKTPIRFVISGSASSPIFRSSQESLLGRIKDRHLLPFSFREYCQYHLRHRPEFAQILDAHRQLRPALLEGDAVGAVGCINQLAETLVPFKTEIDEAVVDYCREGGFPEVWQLPNPVRKIEYLMEQQVHKVLYEDLMMVTKYRKPENVLRFFVYLLAHPGQEINTTKVASEAGVERRVIDDNLPLLEMTDLILRIQKFSHQPLRVRQGNIKCYPADMALRNAVLKTWQNLDADMMGLYAENLVVRELIGWPEKIEISYFREKNREIDFVVSHGGNRYLPIEVKYTERDEDCGALKMFKNRYAVDLGVVITRQQSARFENGLVFLPLRFFLLVS